MHIGLIGGIGPAATHVYYRALVEAHVAADRRLELTIVHADVREMTANMAAGRVAEQAAVFARLIDRLRAGECEAVALTSMGGHFTLPQLLPITSLPIISAIPAIDAWFAENGIRKAGVLGTRAVMESGLYGASSAEVVSPVRDELTATHDAYIAIAIAGAATPEQRAFFHRAGEKLHREQEVDVVVLGGTDLSVAFDGGNPGYPIVDTALVHAAAISKIAIGD